MMGSNGDHCQYQNANFVGDSGMANRYRRNESFLDHATEFWKAVMEMSVEFGKGCRDILSQSLGREDTYLGGRFRRIKGPLAKCILQEATSLIHSWPNLQVQPCLLRWLIPMIQWWQRKSNEEPGRSGRENVNWCTFWLGGFLDFLFISTAKHSCLESMIRLTSGCHCHLEKEWVSFSISWEWILVFSWFGWILEDVGPLEKY